MESSSQDTEKGRQQRSRLESILNVAQRLRLRCFHRLRPRWTAFLSTLQTIVQLFKTYDHELLFFPG
jgi:hypothetical protein